MFGYSHEEGEGACARGRFCGCGYLMCTQKTHISTRGTTVQMTQTCEAILCRQNVYPFCLVLQVDVFMSFPWKSFFKKRNAFQNHSRCCKSPFSTGGGMFLARCLHWGDLRGPKAKHKCLKGHSFQGCRIWFGLYKNKKIITVLNTYINRETQSYRTSEANQKGGTLKWEDQAIISNIIWN